MHQPSLFCLVALLFSTAALADFSVYTNRQIDQVPGSGAMQNGMKIEATREVSCDDFCAGNAIYSFHNDATRNAYACKGCSAGKNSRDWEIEQFEFNNDVATIFNSDGVFYTLRPGPNGGNEYTIHERLSRDDDEVRREGEVCFRESQEVTACQCPLFVASGNKLFFCESALSPA